MIVNATDTERDRVCGSCIARSRRGCNLDSWNECKKGDYTKYNKCIFKGSYP